LSETHRKIGAGAAGLFPCHRSARLPRGQHVAARLEILIKRVAALGALLMQTTRILWLEPMTARGTKPSRYAAVGVDLRPDLSGLDLNPLPQHRCAGDRAVALHGRVNALRKAVIGRPHYPVESKILQDYSAGTVNDVLRHLAIKIKPLPLCAIAPVSNTLPYPFVVPAPLVGRRKILWPPGGMVAPHKHQSSGVARHKPIHWNSAQAILSASHRGAAQRLAVPAIYRVRQAL
jgi:hypothetical protein